LEYRATANPSLILTKNLTIHVRPKPTVSIAPSGTQIVCLNDSVKIQKSSAQNYDTIYWQHIETGDKYYTNDINFKATATKASYALMATNNDCSTLATSIAEFLTVNPNSSPIWNVRLKAASTTNISYCNPVYLDDYVAITAFGMPFELNNSTYYWYNVPNVENSLYKVTDYKITWSTQDIYTQGAPLAGQDYSKIPRVILILSI